MCHVSCTQSSVLQVPYVSEKTKLKVQFNEFIFVCHFSKEVFFETEN